MKPLPQDSVPEAEPHPLALVMGGGGARAAYQVGFLKAIARSYPNLRFPIITGVSAGTINAVHLASHPGSFREAVDDLVRLWGALTMDQVFRVDSRHLITNAVKWGLQLASGGILGQPTIRSLVDTTPLREFLTDVLGEREGTIPGIERKIESGELKALAVTSSSYTAGRSVVWIQGAREWEWSRPHRVAVSTAISVDHIMASAAIPLFFPAVLIDNEWFGDGGLRFSAPLSPAVNLGAERILAISTRFRRSANGTPKRMHGSYPTPARLIGSLLNAMFLDLLDQDAWQLEAMNRILRRVSTADRNEFGVVRLMTLWPSRDLGRLARDFEHGLPRAFRFLMRGLGTHEAKSPDLLSFLLFEPDYLRLLMEIGEADGEARMEEVDALLDDGASPEEEREGAGAGAS